jgi:hypothetical protein
MAMRPSGVRFTIRQLTIAIAIVALPLGPIVVEERRRRASELYSSLADNHDSKTAATFACSRMRCTITDQTGRVLTSDEVNASGWHKQLALKYREAAAHPSLPVEPDLPLP